MSKREFREMVAMAKASFEKIRNITYERYRLFTRAQEPRETLESFHAALTAQAATAELGGLEEELVRDLFISRMNHTALQDTLTFEIFTPDKVLKRDIKFEHSKQTTQAFQKSGSGSSVVGQLRDPQIKIKQEPIMEVWNRNSNYKRQNKNQIQKRWTENKRTNSRSDQKPCTRCGKFFGPVHLKICSIMGKCSKSCNKPNHFAKMCRSNQVNEIGEEKSSSEEECNLIQSFDSCDEFEIMMVDRTVKEPGEKETTGNRFRKKSGKETTNQEITKIDFRRDPKSHKIKALKALLRIKNQNINMTIDTGSPVSYLNWTTAKQLFDGSSAIKFIPAEKLNLTMQFVDYNKHPIQTLGAVCACIRSAGWEVKDAYFLVTERRARCILGLDLQGKLGIHTSQKSAPVNRSRFDVLLCEQSEGMKQQFYLKNSSLFDRQGELKHHVINTKFKYPLNPIQEKGRRIPIHIQGKVQNELDKLLSEGHITKLDKCTSNCFIAPILITVKKDDSIKLALDAKPINRQLYRNKYQMPNVDELTDGVSQTVTAKTQGKLYFKVLDLKYAHIQLRLTAQTAKQCNLNIVGGKLRERTYF